MVNIFSWVWGKMVRLFWLTVRLVCINVLWHLYWALPTGVCRRVYEGVALWRLVCWARGKWKRRLAVVNASYALVHFVVVLTQLILQRHRFGWWCILWGLLSLAHPILSLVMCLRILFSPPLRDGEEDVYDIDDLIVNIDALARCGPEDVIPHMELEDAGSTYLGIHLVKYELDEPLRLPLDVFEEEMEALRDDVLARAVDEIRDRFLPLDVNGIIYRYRCLREQGDDEAKVFCRPVPFSKPNKGEMHRLAQIAEACGNSVALAVYEHCFGYGNYRMEVQHNFDPMLRDKGDLGPLCYDVAMAWEHFGVGADDALDRAEMPISTEDAVLHCEKIDAYERCQFDPDWQKNGLTADQAQERCMHCANMYNELGKKRKDQKPFCYAEDGRHYLGKRKVVITGDANVRCGCGKSLHELNPFVSAGRRNLVAEGDQRLCWAPLRATGIFHVYPREKRIEQEDESDDAFVVDSVLFSPQIAAEASGFVKEQATLALDLVRRRCQGLALNADVLREVIEDTARVAVNHAEELATRRLLFGEHVEDMSRRRAKRIFKGMGLETDEKFYRDEGDAEFKLKNKMNRKQVQVTRSHRIVQILFAGVVIGATAMSFARAIPDQPAKREAVITPGHPSGKNPSVKYDYNPDLSVPLIPVFYDRADPGVAAAAFCGRNTADNGLMTQEGAEQLLAGAKFIYQMLPEIDYTDVDLSKDCMRRWVEERSTWSRKKKDAHLAVIEDMPDQIDFEYMKSVGNCEAFIKDEFYPQAGSFPSTTMRKAKPPRNICNRQMEFKVIVGTILGPLNDVFFEQEFCIKHYPHKERGRVLADKFAGAGACLTTDHSAFECSATSHAQALAETLVYRAFVPRRFWFVLDALMQPALIVNKATGTRLLTDTIRYSGDFNTSLGNSLLNAASAVSAYALGKLPPLPGTAKLYIKSVFKNFGATGGRPLRAFGDPFVTQMAGFEAMFSWFRNRSVGQPQLQLKFMVEGDDAIVAAPDLPPAAEYQRRMRAMGFNVTIEGAEDPSKAGFCSLFWNEDESGIHTYCDIAKQILVSKYGTTPPSRKLTKEELYNARLRSILELFPGCPVLTKMLKERNTVAVDANGYEEDLLVRNGVCFSRVGNYLVYETALKKETTAADRALFAELYGISPESQLVLEQMPAADALAYILRMAFDQPTIADYAETYERARCYALTVDGRITLF